jgi:phytoene desaturase
MAARPSSPIPPCLTQLWALTGHDMAQDVELMPVMPFYRLNWPDGTNFDYSNDEAQLRSEIAKLSRGCRGLRFLDYSAVCTTKAMSNSAARRFLDFASMMKAARRWPDIRHGAASIRWFPAS